MVFIVKEAQEGLIPQHGEMLISLMTIITMAMMTVMTIRKMAIMTIMMVASKMKTKQPLFSDEGSGAEVVLRPGDSVIVRGASQLRGHLVGLFGNHFVGHFLCPFEN